MCLNQWKMIPIGGVWTEGYYVWDEAKNKNTRDTYMDESPHQIT